jgi:prophage antirepressor-like protein
MNNLIQFNYNSKEIRTVSKNGEPWFVATDITEALDIQNATQALCKLDEDERSMFNIGRQGEANIVNEYGLYNLILASRKPEAKQFKRWITHEVIPSIRKHGMYAKDELLDNPDLMIEVLQQLKREREEKKLLQTENKLLTGQALEWTSRKVLEAIVKAYGASIRIPDVNGFQEAWKDFKKELLYNHGININLRVSKAMESSGRKTKPKTMDMIHDEELSACISTAVALCKSHSVDISDIISKYKN